MNRLSASGLADLAATTTVEVQRLVELGILVARDGPDPFLSSALPMPVSSSLVHAVMATP